MFISKIQIIINIPVVPRAVLAGTPVPGRSNHARLVEEPVETGQRTDPGPFQVGVGQWADNLLILQDV